MTHLCAWCRKKIEEKPVKYVRHDGTELYMHDMCFKEFTKITWGNGNESAESKSDT